MKMAKPDADIEEIKQAGVSKGKLLRFYHAAATRISYGDRRRRWYTVRRRTAKNHHRKSFVERQSGCSLDEATAYSDPDNEAEIQKSIDVLVKNKTVIMIAHRLSTIIHADKIIVLNHGEIEAEGTHGELLAQNETYRKN